MATAGETVTLHATWAACPTTPICGDGICGIDETATSCPADCTNPLGCTGSEQYLVLDPTTMTLAPAGGDHGGLVRDRRHPHLRHQRPP